MVPWMHREELAKFMSILQGIIESVVEVANIMELRNRNVLIAQVHNPSFFKDLNVHAYMGTL